MGAATQQYGDLHNQKRINSRTDWLPSQAQLVCSGQTLLMEPLTSIPSALPARSTFHQVGV